MTIEGLCRVAWLPPKIEWERGPTRAGWGAEVMLAELERATRSHPQLSVLEDSDVTDLATLFLAGRRDVVGWFELTERGGTVRLRMVAHDVHGGEHTHDSVVAVDVGEAITGAVAAWLSARGLAPLPRPVASFTCADLAAAATALGEVEAEVARRRREHQLAREEGRDVDQGDPVPPPAVTTLGVATCRVAARRLRVEVLDRIRELDPADLAVRLEDANTADELAAITAAAPGWAAPFAAALAREEDKHVRVRLATEALARAPLDPAALHAAGDALWARFRRDDAVRVYDRAIGCDVYDLDAHSKAMAALRESGRIGAAYHDACARFDGFPEDAGNGGLFGNPSMIWCRLRFANILWSIGRVDEAIEARERTLASAFGNWSNQTQVLDEWKNGATPRVHAYAREGYFRGDVGRAVAGGAAAPIEQSGVLIALLHGLVETGNADLAVLAWHHYRPSRAGRSVIADLVAARALIETGDATELPALLMSAGMRGAQSEFGPEVNRCLRAAVCVGFAPWAAAVEAELARGARSMAARLARDAADFFAEAESHPTVRTLATSTGIPAAVDPAWFAPMRAAIGKAVAAPVDAFFDAWTGDDLLAADRAVDTWTEVVQAPPPDADRDTCGRYIEQLLYLATRAIAGYLAATAGPAGPRAGALRTIADDALSALGWWRARPSIAAITHMVQALEPVAAAPAWLVDPFLLRLERMLRLEELLGGHVELVTGGAPVIGSLLRGPERIAAEEAAAAAALEKEPARAAALYERCVRAIGGNIAPAWSEAVEAAGGDPEAALDVHLSAVFAHPFSAGAAVRATKILCARGDTDAAFELLVDRFHHGGWKWREERLAELRPLMERGWPVPIDADAAQTVAFEAIQAGDYAHSIRAYKWVNAVDPGIEMCLKNLGLASALSGHAADALRFFSAASPEEGPLWAAQQLYQGGHMAASTAMYRYLLLSPASVDVWQQAAAIAYAAEDDETCALAYGVVDAREPERMDGPNLNAWAGVLDNLGEYQACARVAKRLGEVAGGDPMLESCAAHHMACALLGLGRAAEALPLAEHAIAINPSPDNAGVFAETADLCRTDGRRPPMVGRRTTPAGRAAGDLARGDVKAVLELDTGELAWDVRRVVLAASRYRFASEDGIAVTPRALACARAVLADSAGATEPHACLARAIALRVREDDVHPVERPPGLGGRLSRDEVAHWLGDDVDVIRLELGSDRSDEDVELFAGQPVAALSQFAALMHRIQCGDFTGALVDAGLDLDGLAAVGKRWGDALADDSALAANLRRRMAVM